MTGPDQLHDDGVRLGRKRSWVVLGVVLVVLAGLVVVRLRDPATEPVPRPTQTRAATSSARDPWPAGLPAGTLFVVAAGSVSLVDTSTGAVTTTGVDADPADTRMTRLADGVLVWRSDTRNRQVLLADGRALPPVPGELRAATSFLPGPDGQVWGTSTRRRGGTTWRLVDAEGRATRSVSVVGAARSDGTGGLLETGDQGVRPTFPQARRSWEAGQLVAAGPDGYIVRSCAQGECRFALHPHQGRRAVALNSAVGEDTGGGTVSPANRLLAVNETVGGATTLRVSVVATGEVKDIFANPAPNPDNAVWLDDRWLALVSEDQLVLYDAADDLVVVPDLPLSAVGSLAWRPA